jgi:hypothetical protein
MQRREPRRFSGVVRARLGKEGLLKCMLVPAVRDEVLDEQGDEVAFRGVTSMGSSVGKNDRLVMRLWGYCT